MIIAVGVNAFNAIYVLSAILMHKIVYNVLIITFRYFSCPMNYGLFAPVYKVVKSVPARTITRTRVINTKTNQWKPSQV